MEGFIEIYELSMEGQTVLFDDIERALEDIRSWAEEGDSTYPGPSLRRLVMKEDEFNELKEHEGY